MVIFVHLVLCFANYLHTYIYIYIYIPNIINMPCGKIYYYAMCQILIDGWQSMMSTWHHGCNYNGIA
jgi:hypothetical protein